MSMWKDLFDTLQAAFHGHFWIVEIFTLVLLVLLVNSFCGACSAT